MKKIFFVLIVIAGLPFISSSAQARTHNWYYIGYEENAPEAQVRDIYKTDEQGEAVKEWILIVSEKTEEDEPESGVIGVQVDKEPDGEEPKLLKPEELFDEEPVKRQKKQEREDKGKRRQ